MTADWIVFYDDGHSFSSLDGQPWEAPRSFVLCIAVADPSCGNYILAETNFYCWHYEDDAWVGHDLNGLVQYLQKPGDRKLVMCGYYVNRDRYLTVRKNIHKDPRLPKKTANGPRQPVGQP